MEKNRIFGTPLEPFFNNNSLGLSPSLLEDSLHTLAENNEKNMENANEKQGYFKNGKSAGKNYLLRNFFRINKYYKGLTITFIFFI